MRLQRAPMAILLPPALVALLADIVSADRDGAPHTALVAAPPHAGHAVVVAHSLPTRPPWPPVRPAPEEADDDARASMYAALAGGAYDEQRPHLTAGEPLMLDSEVRILTNPQLGAPCSSGD